MRHTQKPVSLSLAATAIVSLLSWTGSSEAHQQWLSPNFFMQSGDSAWLSFDHTFGDRRYLPSSGPGSYYSWWVVGPDGLKKNVPHLFLGKTRTVGEIELTDAGTYRIEAVEDVMPWTMIKVDGEDRWQPGTRADFDGAEIVRSREYFTKAVSYVTLDSMSQSAVAGKGDPIEILFDDHPNDLRAGQEFQLRVLASGEPMADQEVRLFSEFSEGHDATETCQTDSRGICEFAVSTPGRYLLASNTQGENPDDSATDGFSHSYSVLVEVRAADD